MDLLDGKTLVKKTGEEFEEISVNEALKNVQIVGFYFSAHWCMPCRVFTPCLVDCYQELRAKKKPFEVIFVSADESPDSARTYMKECHGEWMSTAFDDTELHDSLAKSFSVMRIPQLIIVKKNGGQVVTSHGCRDVKEKGGEAFVAWFEGKAAISSRETLLFAEAKKSQISAKENDKSSSKMKARVGESRESEGPRQSDPDSVTGPTKSKSGRKFRDEIKDQTEEISKQLEQVGVRKSVAEQLKKSPPTRMLTMRDVEQSAVKTKPETSGSSVGAEKSGKAFTMEGTSPKSLKAIPRIQKTNPTETPLREVTPHEVPRELPKATPKTSPRVAAKQIASEKEGSIDVQKVGCASKGVSDAESADSRPSHGEGSRKVHKSKRYSKKKAQSYDEGTSKSKTDDKLSKSH